MKRSTKRFIDVAICALVWLSLAPFLGSTGFAHDHDQPWQDQWYENLKQPDNPTASCCGPADAYWADSFEQEKGQYVAIVTDERPDEPLKRPHVPVGTRILVPNHKIKWNEGNPTGHGVVFLSRADYVFCYVPPGGV